MHLPDEGELQLGPVALPAGKWVRTGAGWGGPVAWVTREAVPRAGRVWEALSGAHQDTGLVPFLLGHLRDHPDRPWDTGEFDDPADVALVDAIDVGEMLEAEWEDKTREVAGEDRWHAEYLAEAIAPFSRRFPGLAPPGDTPLTGRELRKVLDSVGRQRIGLVPAARPADVLPLVGWTEEAVLEVAAVLRSWEDRFGARLLKLGLGDLSLLTARPPRSAGHAERIAAEHFALCDECAGCGLKRISQITEYLLKTPIWTFWWD